jgi:hypothetical protein
MLIAAGALAAPATAMTVDLEFDVYGGGLYLAQGAVTLNADVAANTPSPYKARVRMAASKWLGYITGFTYLAESSGSYARPDFHSASFSTERHLRSRKNRLAIRFGDDVHVDTEPAVASEKLDRVPQDMRRATIDPLSTALAVVAAADTAAPCTGTYPVYDGLRRFDIVMAPIGPTELKASSYSMAAGPALACTARLIPIAGFKDARDTGAAFSQGVERTATMWFARIEPGAPMVPVRGLIETALGNFYVHIVALKIIP